MSNPNFPAHWRTDTREIVAELEAAGWRVCEREDDFYCERDEDDFYWIAMKSEMYAFYLGPTLKFEPFVPGATRALHEVMMGRSAPVAGHRSPVATRCPKLKKMKGHPPTLRACQDCTQRLGGGPVLHDELWATFAQPDEFLCFGCIEKRLGRGLTQADLHVCPFNAGWISFDGADVVALQFAHGRKLLPA